MVVVICVFFLPGNFSGLAAAQQPPTASRAAKIETLRSPHPAIKVWREIRYQPRLVRFYVIEIDARTKHLIWDVAVAPDPDGEGPSQAGLMDQVELARRNGLIAAVATNAFGLRPAEPKTSTPPSGDTRGATPKPVVEVYGWVKTRTRTVAPVDPGKWSFWITPEGVPQIGNPKEEVPAQIAVAGFGPLVLDGKVVAGSGGTPDIQIALGLDRDRARVFLVGVDGRRPGWSGGLTNHELATLLLELGAYWAILLDPSGSGIIRDSATGRFIVLSRGVDIIGLRPRPVLLGVRPAYSSP
jgi:hypothetical protein